MDAVRLPYGPRTTPHRFCLSVHVSVCLSVCLFVCPCVCLSVCMSVFRLLLLPLPLLLCIPLRYPTFCPSSYHTFYPSFIPPLPHTHTLFLPLEPKVNLSQVVLPVGHLESLLTQCSAYDAFRKYRVQKGLVSTFLVSRTCSDCSYCLYIMLSCTLSRSHFSTSFLYVGGDPRLWK